MAGGEISSGYTSSAELYNPAAGTWSATGSLATARSAHNATLLRNGKVLAAGGRNLLGPNLPATDLNSVELYDPATGTWSATGSLGMARESFTATLLPDGKVLAVGGQNYLYTLGTAELYNPAAAGFMPGIFDLLLLQ